MATSNTSLIDESQSSSSLEFSINHSFHGKHQYDAEVKKQYSKRLKTSYVSNKFHVFGRHDVLIVTFEECNLKRKATLDESELLISFYRKFCTAQEYQNITQADNIIRFAIHNWRWTSWQCMSAFAIGNSRYQRLKRELSAQNHPSIGDVKLFNEFLDDDSIDRDGTTDPMISGHKYCKLAPFIQWFEMTNLNRKATPEERTTLTSFYRKFASARDRKNFKQVLDIMSFIIHKLTWTCEMCESLLQVRLHKCQEISKQKTIIIGDLRLFVDSFDENSGRDGTNKHAPVSISCNQHCCYQIFIDYSKHCAEQSLEEPQVLRDYLDKVVPFQPRVSEWKCKQDVYTDYNTFCKVYPMHYGPLSRATFFRNITTTFDEVIKSNILSA
jgi:hypothetical protein